MITVNVSNNDSLNSSILKLLRVYRCLAVSTNFKCKQQSIDVIPRYQETADIGTHVHIMYILFSSDSITQNTDNNNVTKIAPVTSLDLSLFSSHKRRGSAQQQRYLIVILVLILFLLLFYLLASTP